MRQSKIKQLRDFIESHEARYFVEHSRYDEHTYIKKAFKVEVNNAEYWVHFAYGTRPVIKDERILLKTMDEAKEKAAKWREDFKKKNKEQDANEKVKMEEVTKYLGKFSWFGYKNHRTNEIKPECQPFAQAIKRVYGNMPSREWDDEKTYIALLERYIQTGTIYTQAMSFHKDHIVSVKYGEDEAVQIELINGKTIIPKGQGVTRLIKIIYGRKLDDWSYDYIVEPEDKYDKIE